MAIRPPGAGFLLDRGAGGRRLPLSQHVRGDPGEDAEQLPLESSLPPCRLTSADTSLSPSQQHMAAIGRLGVKILPAHRVSMLNLPSLHGDSS